MPADSQLSALRRIAIMTALVLAGEIIFLLPFVFPRIFRPVMLEVFGINNFELGSAFSVYGIVAMISYFFGGPLADRFSARYLMTCALLATSAGGLLMATIPGIGSLYVVYGFWGMTTILLFWAAMLRSARVWGGEDKQGRAYGILDGGRGLAAALLATAAVWVFAQSIPEGAFALEDKRAAMRNIILMFSGVTAVAALLIWAVIPSKRIKRASKVRADFSTVSDLARKPAVWLQAIIVLCAYAGYKSSDDFSLYARDALALDDIGAARIGTVTFWIRPFAAVAAGWLADRLQASRVVIAGFVVMGFGSLGMAMDIFGSDAIWLLILNIGFLSIGIYAIRGVYFALIAESGIPVQVTGTAIGIISTVGFLPDIFMGPAMGALIDNTPGPNGHQHVFMLTTGFAVAGLVAAVYFRKLATRMA